MKKFICQLTNIYPSTPFFDISLLVFRILVSLELIVAHGLKKIGIGVAQAEQVPNPLHLPESLNSFFAISANLFFPVLVILGLFTRIAVLPILAVTLMGYFVVHWNDSLLAKDTPFIYSVVYLFILVMGPGRYSADQSINERIQLSMYKG
jgi:putative oxidoreductase